MSVPDVPAPRPPRTATTAARTLRNGVEVLAARRSGVPMVEFRLRIPDVAATESAAARRLLVTESLLLGTPRFDATDIASTTQRLGGSLTTASSADAVYVYGAVLARNLTPMLEFLAEILSTASFPAPAVGAERERLARELVIRRSRPETIAGESMRARMFGNHPYGMGLPDPEQVAGLTTRMMRRYRDRLGPNGAQLVLCGHISTGKAIEAAEALELWAGGAGTAAPPQPDFETGPILFVDRPGSVQTNIRVGGTVATRRDATYPATDLAMTLFGGSSSSRLMANIREDKGYSYSPRASVQHAGAGSRLVVSVNVATDVTAAAYSEIVYELSRMITTTVDGDELDRARRYRIGTTAISVQSQTGLTAQLATLVAAGLPPSFLRDHALALQNVSASDVLGAARRWLTPQRLVTVMVGDASQVVDELELLAPVEVAG